MKLVKSLLLGSAAGLCAVAGAQAADLPVRRAAPVEYVRVCTAYGAGFFYIPGTDTCLRVGGRARFEYQYTSNRAVGPGQGVINNLVNGDNSGFRALGRINLDARTQTSYGTLRTFVRVEMASRTGGHLTSGTQQRIGNAFPALGQDTFGRAQQYVNLDKAFIQFAGFTAGRAASFYDFYAHDLELIAGTAGSDVNSTNILAYTATFGGGWSATISIEDPIFRRQPRFTDQVFGSTAAIGTGGSSAGFTTVGGIFTQRVPVAFNAAGLPSVVASYDVVQRTVMPDVVLAIRYDAPWGAAQVSGAVHELSGGRFLNAETVTYPAGGGTPTFTPTALANARQPSVEYGFAVQGGLKLNLPQLATGDVLWLQAAYSEGAMQYAGAGAMPVGGSYSTTNTLTRFSVNTVDSFIGSDGKQKLTEAWSVTGAFLHYWAPEWRSAVFGSYSEVTFGKGARTGAGPAGLILAPGSALATNNLAFGTTLRDYSASTVGANLIWSPVKDLDIGVEGIYQRIDLKNGRTQDLSFGTGAGLSSALGVPVKTVKSDDVFIGRFRVQRDF